MIVSELDHLISNSRFSDILLNLAQYGQFSILWKTKLKKWKRVHKKTGHTQINPNMIIDGTEKYCLLQILKIWYDYLVERTCLHHSTIFWSRPDYVGTARRYFQSFDSVDMFFESLYGLASFHIMKLNFMICSSTDQPTVSTLRHKFDTENVSSMSCCQWSHYTTSKWIPNDNTKIIRAWGKLIIN